MYALQHDHILQLMQSVPPQARTTALIMTVLTIAIATLVALAIRRHVAVASGYLLVLSVFLAWCGSHDAARMAPYRSLITTRGIARDGHAADYLGLLQREAAYFHAVGDDEEALRSRRDAEVFARTHGLAP